MRQTKAMNNSNSLRCGLAISLIFGTVVSTVLSMFVVPVLCHLFALYVNKATNIL